MLFNSIEFAIFLPIVFVVYWFLVQKNLRLQNFWIVVTSYVFYGWWDWRFLTLIVFSSLLDFGVGIALVHENREGRRKFWILVSILVNLGLLGFFKYYNFFVQSFADAFTFFGTPVAAARLNIILPVGISFYTFQTLSYSIDVYRRKLSPTKDLIAFLAYVTFFPQLVAGPIERAKSLLPQFYKERVFEYAKAVDGMRQILWGLFKKMVIADTCAIYANQIFDSPENYAGSTLLFGAFLFAFQIYGDFSGYSDIAIGTAKLFGFSLMRNFAFPYFSRDIAEFWRRWHISLSTWFRDYVYIPLGGSHGTKYKAVRNTILVFVISGFWHGANLTFIFWGLLNALYFLPLLLTEKNRVHTNIPAEGRLLPGIKEAAQMLSTFFLTLIAWVFFRAANLHEAVAYIGTIFSSSLLTLPQVHPLKIILLILLLIIVEWLQRDKQHGLAFDKVPVPRPLRWLAYYGLLVLIVLFGGHQQEFIYFQF